MQWLWTWGGQCFGYRDGDDLWTADGKHVGRFYDQEIYGTDGKYLGETLDNERLITNRSKKSYSKSAFSSHGRRVGYVRQVNYVGIVMYAGYEDFPKPDSF